MSSAERAESQMPPILAYLVFSLATVIELLICWFAILWLAKQGSARLGVKQRPSKQGGEHGNN